MPHLPIPKLTEQDTHRFWGKVGFTANPNCCWNWQAGKNNDGYGNFSIREKEYKSHRVAYYLHYGIDPLDKKVCHHCDNTSCNNGAHLFLGTDLDNARDKIAKGRAVNVKGEDSGNAKLTEAQVAEIRELSDQKISSTIIAKKFNIHFAQVRKIARYKNWKHIGDSDLISDKDKNDYAVGSRHGHARMTEEIVLAMRDDYKNGVSVQSISHKYHINQSGASRIVNRKRWTHI